MVIQFLGEKTLKWSSEAPSQNNCQRGLLNHQLAKALTNIWNRS